MNSQQDINLWTEGVISFWKSQKIKLGIGASLLSINEAEKTLGINFPDTFKELYKKANGFENFDWNENMFSIWSLERILDEYGRCPNFVGFSDFLINSHCIGFVKDQPGIYKQYDLQRYSKPEKVADSFEEAIELINSNADIIY